MGGEGGGGGGGSGEGKGGGKVPFRQIKFYHYTTANCTQKQKQSCFFAGCHSLMQHVLARL